MPLSIHIGDFDRARVFRTDTVIVLFVCLVFGTYRNDKPCYRNRDIS
jgi:hypothetical protein